MWLLFSGFVYELSGIQAIRLFLWSQASFRRAKVRTLQNPYGLLEQAGHPFLSTLRWPAVGCGVDDYTSELKARMFVQQDI